MYIELPTTRGATPASNIATISQDDDRREGVILDSAKFRPVVELCQLGVFSQSEMSYMAALHRTIEADTMEKFDDMVDDSGACEHHTGCVFPLCNFSGLSSARFSCIGFR